MSVSPGQALQLCTHKLKGISQFSFASLTSVSTSLRSLETSAVQQDRIDKQLRGLKKGDMIQIQRTCFLHYAIYIVVSDGKRWLKIVVTITKSASKHMIVDFVADNGGEVSSRNLYETVGGCDCAVNNYLDETFRPSPQEEIVLRAKSSIAEDFTYDISQFNCEHFATWCRYSFKFCRQPCDLVPL